MELPIKVALLTGPLKIRMEPDYCRSLTGFLDRLRYQNIEALINIERDGSQRISQAAFELAARLSEFLKP